MQPLKVCYNWFMLEDRGLLASTKPSRENVYNLVSESEVENLTKIVSSPEQETQIAAELAKEAETFFSASSQEAPLPAIGVSVEDWFDQDELDRDLTPLRTPQGNDSGDHAPPTG